MKDKNVDFFYEGEVVPDTVKSSIYKMEDASATMSNRSVFENIMSALLEEFMRKKNISLTSVNKFVNEKAKNIKTYILQFEDDKGNSFKCSYIGERDTLKTGTTDILASSIIFTFAEYGCKICSYNDKDCEFCDRSKIDKIFPPELKSTIKHNMKEFIKVFGSKSVKSIKDFCNGYYDHLRNQKTKSFLPENNESLSTGIKEIVDIDLGVIGYVIQMATTILGEYANNNQDVRNLMSEYTNVEKSFFGLIQQLKKYYNFIKMVQENPNVSQEEIVSNFHEMNEDDDEEDDDEDDDEDDAPWKKDSDEA